MLCTACNKESKNQRVCPYCFTPYAPDVPPAPRRSSQRTPSPSGATQAPVGSAAAELYENARAFVMRQSPVVRWTGLAIVIVLVLWQVTAPAEGDLPAGATVPEVALAPMAREEAEAVLRQTRENALVDVQQDEVFVSYTAAAFPVREDGQFLLAQQYARADAVVEGRKRRIFFYNPNGKLFAQSDAARGVIAAP